MAFFSKSTVFFLLFGCIIFSIGACSRRETAPLPPGKPAEMPMKKSEQIEADIFYDATLSMQGFVNPGITTSYARTVERLEGSVMSGWPEARTVFYKFGTDIIELDGREQKNAVKPVFFKDPELLRVTSLEKVIDRANIGHLTIIVTDLFQDDADYTQLVNKIKDKYLWNDVSIGLLGIQSDFHGTVYDVGIFRDKFPYTGKRPFYIMMIGKHKDLEHLYNNLHVRILHELTDTNFVLLSRYFSHPMPFLAEAAVISKINIDETTNILPHDVKDSRTKQLRIKNSSQNSQLILSLPRARLPYTPEPSISSIESRITAWKAQSIAKQDTMIAFPEVRDALTVEAAISDSTLELQINLDGAKLKQTGIYIFEHSIILKDNVDFLPQWISAWDMNITKLQDWKQHPGTFEGNTTLNLKKFTLDLFQAIVQIQKPEISRALYYIRKE